MKDVGELDGLAMTPAKLRKSGELLYGSRWQTELARALNVNPRQVRQWHAGERSMPPHLKHTIVSLIKEKSRLLLEYADELDGF